MSLSPTASYSKYEESGEEMKDVGGDSKAADSGAGGGGGAAALPGGAAMTISAFSPSDTSNNNNKGSSFSSSTAARQYVPPSTTTQQSGKSPNRSGENNESFTAASTQQQQGSAAAADESKEEIADEKEFSSSRCSGIYFFSSAWCSVFYVVLLFSALFLRQSVHIATLIIAIAKPCVRRIRFRGVTNTMPQSHVITISAIFSSMLVLALVSVGIMCFSGSDGLAMAREAAYILHPLGVWNPVDHPVLCGLSVVLNVVILILCILYDRILGARTAVGECPEIAKRRRLHERIYLVRITIGLAVAAFTRPSLLTVLFYVLHILVLASFCVKRTVVQKWRVLQGIFLITSVYASLYLLVFLCVQNDFFRKMIANNEVPMMWGLKYRDFEEVLEHEFALGVFISIHVLSVFDVAHTARRIHGRFALLPVEEAEAYVHDRIIERVSEIRDRARKKAQKVGLATTFLNAFIDAFPVLMLPGLVVVVNIVQNVPAFGVLLATIFGFCAPMFVFVPALPALYVVCSFVIAYAFVSEVVGGVAAEWMALYLNGDRDFNRAINMVSLSVLAFCCTCWVFVFSLKKKLSTQRQSSKTFSALLAAKRQKLERALDVVEDKLHPLAVQFKSLCNPGAQCITRDGFAAVVQVVYGVEPTPDEVQKIWDALVLNERLHLHPKRDPDQAVSMAANASLAANDPNSSSSHVWSSSTTFNAGGGADAGAGGEGAAPLPSNAAGGGDDVSGGGGGGGASSALRARSDSMAAGEEGTTTRSRAMSSFSRALQFMIADEYDDEEDIMSSLNHREDQSLHNLLLQRAAASSLSGAAGGGGEGATGDASSTPPGDGSRRGRSSSTRRGRSDTLQAAEEGQSISSSSPSFLGFSAAESGGRLSPSPPGERSVSAGRRSRGPSMGPRGRSQSQHRSTAAAATAAATTSMLAAELLQQEELAIMAEHVHARRSSSPMGSAASQRHFSTGPSSPTSQMFPLGASATNFAANMDETLSSTMVQQAMMSASQRSAGATGGAGGSGVDQEPQSLANFGGHREESAAFAGLPPPVIGLRFSAFLEFHSEVARYRMWDANFFFVVVALLRDLVSRNTESFSLFIMFAAASFRPDLDCISFFYILLFVVFLCFPTIRQKYWTVLIAYNILVIVVLYSFSLVYHEETQPEKIGLVDAKLLGLRVLSSPADLYVNFVLLAVGNLQLRTKAASATATASTTATSDASSPSATSSSSPAAGGSGSGGGGGGGGGEISVRHILSDMEWIRISATAGSRSVKARFALLVTVVCFMAVVAVEDQSALVGVFAFTFVAKVRSLNTNPTSGMAFFLSFVNTIYSVGALVAVALYQFPAIRDWFDERIGSWWLCQEHARDVFQCASDAGFQSASRLGRTGFTTLLPWFVASTSNIVLFTLSGSSDRSNNSNTTTQQQAGAASINPTVGDAGNTGKASKKSGSKGGAAPAPALNKNFLGDLTGGASLRDAAWISRPVHLMFTLLGLVSQAADVSRVWLSHHGSKIVWLSLFIAGIRYRSVLNLLYIVLLILDRRGWTCIIIGAFHLAIVYVYPLFFVPAVPGLGEEWEYYLGCPKKAQQGTLGAPVIVMICSLVYLQAKRQAQVLRPSLPKQGMVFFANDKRTLRESGSRETDSLIYATEISQERERESNNNKTVQLSITAKSSTASTNTSSSSKQEAASDDKSSNKKSDDKSSNKSSNKKSSKPIEKQTSSLADLFKSQRRGGGKSQRGEHDDEEPLLLSPRYQTQQQQQSKSFLFRSSPTSTAQIMRSTAAMTLDYQKFEDDLHFTSAASSPHHHARGGSGDRGDGDGDDADGNNADGDDDGLDAAEQSDNKLSGIVSAEEFERKRIAMRRMFPLEGSMMLPRGVIQHLVQLQYIVRRFFFSVCGYELIILLLLIGITVTSAHITAVVLFVVIVMLWRAGRHEVLTGARIPFFCHVLCGLLLLAYCILDIGIPPPFTDAPPMRKSASCSESWWKYLGCDIPLVDQVFLFFAVVMLRLAYVGAEARIPLIIRPTAGCLTLGEYFWSKEAELTELRSGERDDADAVLPPLPHDVLMQPRTLPESIVSMYFGFFPTAVLAFFHGALQTSVVSVAEMLLGLCLIVYATDIYWLFYRYWGKVTGFLLGLIAVQLLANLPPVSEWAHAQPNVAVSIGVAPWTLDRVSTFSVVLQIAVVWSAFVQDRIFNEFFFAWKLHQLHKGSILNFKRHRHLMVYMARKSREQEIQAEYKEMQLKKRLDKIREKRFGQQLAAAAAAQQQQQQQQISTKRIGSSSSETDHRQSSPASSNNNSNKGRHHVAFRIDPDALLQQEPSMSEFQQPLPSPSESSSTTALSAASSRAIKENSSNGKTNDSTTPTAPHQQLRSDERQGVATDSSKSSKQHQHQQQEEEDSHHEQTSTTFAEKWQALRNTVESKFTELTLTAIDWLSEHSYTGRRPALHYHITTRFAMALYKFMVRRTGDLCVLAFAVNFAESGSIADMLLCVSGLIHALVVLPWCSESYWEGALVYSVFSILIKSAIKICAENVDMTYNAKTVVSVMFLDLGSSSGYSVEYAALVDIIFDFMAFGAILIHRRFCVLNGVYVVGEQDKVKKSPEEEKESADEEEDDDDDVDDDEDDENKTAALTNKKRRGASKPGDASAATAGGGYTKFEDGEAKTQQRASSRSAGGTTNAMPPEEPNSDLRFHFDRSGVDDGGAAPGGVAPVRMSGTLAAPSGSSAASTMRRRRKQQAKNGDDDDDDVVDNTSFVQRSRRSRHHPPNHQMIAINDSDRDDDDDDYENRPEDEDDDEEEEDHDGHDDEDETAINEGGGGGGGGGGRATTTDPHSPLANAVSSTSSSKRHQSEWFRQAKRIWRRGVRRVERFLEDLQGNIKKKSGSGSDFYTLYLTVDFLVLIYTTFSYYGLMGSARGSFLEGLQQNLLPGPLVVAMLGLVLSMIVDRIIYVMSSTKYKFLFHVFQCLVVHSIYIAWKIWFNSPDIAAGVTLFFIKFLYLYVCCAQIRFGFAAHRRHDPFTEQATILYWLGHVIYRAVPFLWELRVLLDWSFARTALRLKAWWFIEDVHFWIFNRFTDIDDDRLTNPKRGTSFPIITRILHGVILFVFIIFILFFPLMYYSTFNPNLVPNRVNSLTARLSFSEVTEIYDSTSLGDTDTGNANRMAQARWLQKSIAETRPTVGTYHFTDDTRHSQLIELSSCSANIWDISPYTRHQLLKRIERGIDMVKGKSDRELQAITHFTEVFFLDMALRVIRFGSVGGQTNDVVIQRRVALPERSLKQLYNIVSRRKRYSRTETALPLVAERMIQQNTNISYGVRADAANAVWIPAAMDPFVFNRPTTVKLFTQLKAETAGGGGGSGSGDGGGGAAVSQADANNVMGCLLVNYGFNETFGNGGSFSGESWCLRCEALFKDNTLIPVNRSNYMCGGERCNFEVSPPQNSSFPGLYFVALSEPIPAEGGFLPNIGIIALYTTFILTLFTILRRKLTMSSHRVVLEECADPRPVAEIVSYIYLVRSVGVGGANDLMLEELLYHELLDLIRSPESMLGLTGRRVQDYEPTTGKYTRSIEVNF